MNNYKNSTYASVCHFQNEATTTIQSIIYLIHMFVDVDLRDKFFANIRKYYIEEIKQASSLYSYIH